MAQKKNRRNAIIAALAVLVVALAVGGTIAWLTASNSVTNTFTVGQITQPDPDVPDKPNPDLPDPGKEDDDGTDASLTGNIYELFTPNSPIVPGDDTRKEPYIGIGKDSEDAFVFVYVENAMTTMGQENSNVTAADLPCFKLADGWAPVSDHATPATMEGGYYTSGLFKWVGMGNDSLSEALALKASDSSAVWTGEVFESVYCPESTVFEDFASAPEMNVYCYLYADVNDVDPWTAEAEAVTWATTGGLKKISGTVAGN